RLAVVPPRFSIHARSGLLLKLEEGPLQHAQVINVVEQRGESGSLVLPCCFSYPLQRTRHVAPALRPERVLLSRIPFGQAPSLHPLRLRLPGFVRGLLRYYGPVRLPVFVHHRRLSIDFSMRPEQLP